MDRGESDRVDTQILRFDVILNLNLSWKELNVL